MTILSAIFYLFAFIVLIYEIQSLLYPRQIMDLIERVVIWKESKETAEQQNTYVIVDKNGNGIRMKSAKLANNMLSHFNVGEVLILAIHTIYIWWCIVGLFSDQFLLFVGIFVQSAMMNNNRKSVPIQVADAAISILLILAIYANHYLHFFDATFSKIFTDILQLFGFTFIDFL